MHWDIIPIAPKINRNGDTPKTSANIAVFPVLVSHWMFDSNFLPQSP
jgi:hypothetical protein